MGQGVLSREAQHLGLAACGRIGRGRPQDNSRWHTPAVKRWHVSVRCADGYHSGNSRRSPLGE